MNPYFHALSSVKRWGGKVEDYLPLHQFLDQSKSYIADVRHRALRHHAEGIFLLERLFGPVLTNDDGRVIPTRAVGERHVQEDLGFIPSVQDWLANLKLQPWMLRVAVKEKDLEATGSKEEEILPLRQTSRPPKLVLRCFSPAEGDKP